jgi:hypothetical protein
MLDTEYNEATCTTAGQLRRLGLDIPEGIPDRAWVPKAALKSRVTYAAYQGERIAISIAIDMVQPFRWTE